MRVEGRYTRADRKGVIPVPTGRGEARDKKVKKKAKEKLEKDLLKKSAQQPVQPLTVEIIRPKRKTEEEW